MNRQQFKHYLKYPEQLSVKDTAEIEEVLKKFPYFQTAHLLYLKALHNNNDTQYNIQLKKTAAYSLNRTILYQLINKKNKIVEKNISQNQVELEQEKRALKPENTAPKNEENVVSNLEIHNEVIAETENTLYADQIEEKPFVSDELDQEILKEAANASFEINLEQLEETTTETEKISSDKVEEEKKSAFTQTKHSFEDWLHWTSESSNLIFERKTDNITEELIAKFLEVDPKIKPKTAFYSPVNMARQSVMEEKFIVTETLANIYEQQGNYAKAIQSYEILKTKYPQKNKNFNDKIRTLKKLLNKNK